MALSKRKLERALRSKGFEESTGHHKFFVYWTKDGMVTPVRTKTSHTRKMKDIPSNLVGVIARQLRLSTEQFLDLVECPLSREAYEEILKAEEHI